MMFVLKGHRPVRTLDPIRWGMFLESPARIVGQARVKGLLISTVFIGLGHPFGGRSQLFETAVFESHPPARRPRPAKERRGRRAFACKSPRIMELVRYNTWKEAEKGHARMVAKLEGK